MSVTGRVYLVGAGPGAPDLITVRGLRCLRVADAVLYDRLVDPALLEEAPAAAERTYVGKAPGGMATDQETIHRALIERARAGYTIVRLKGGDPFVFGRGGEEAAALARAGVPFEVVPGLSSAFAVPTHAGLPVTHRGLARSVALVTGHRGDGNGAPGAALAEVADADTLVVLMATATLEEVVDTLRLRGRAVSTPAAVIESGTLPGERLVVAPLGDIARRAREARVKPPAILMVGEVVDVHGSLVQEQSVALAAAARAFGGNDEENVRKRKAGT